MCHQKTYKDFYLGRVARGDHVILDNGAAEGLEFGHKHLHTIAEQFGVTEVVVPDTLRDWNDTVAKAHYFKRHTRSFRYMAVAQGTNLQEALRCIDAFMSIGYITSIGIPRLLNDTDPRTRIQIAEFIKKEGWDLAVEFHALGNSRWVEEVKVLAEYDCIRGIDTSLPIYLGQEKRLLTSGEYLKRPDYFFRNSVNYPEVNQNVQTFLEWAKYD